MTKLNNTQSGTLLAVVQYANKNSGIIPTAKELGKMLKLNERAAAGRIKRIIDGNPNDFNINGRLRKINYEQLCTEPETAMLLMAVRSNLDSNGRISGSKIKTLVLRHNMDGSSNIVDRLCAAGYIERLHFDGNSLRLTTKFVFQIEYLRRLADMI